MSTPGSYFQPPPLLISPSPDVRAGRLSQTFGAELGILLGRAMGRASNRAAESLFDNMLARCCRQVAAGTCIVLIMELMGDGVSCS